MAEVQVHNPADFDETDWAEFHDIARRAFTEAFAERDQAEVDTFIHWDDPDFFRAYHLDPNRRVGHGYTADQAYSRPRMAVATEGDNKIGYLWGALNVSFSSDLEHLKKRLTITRNYLYLGEIAVDPDHQHEGVAHEMLRQMALTTLPMRRVSAFVLNSETPEVAHALQSFGFNAYLKEGRFRYVFGEDRDPAVQIPLRAKSALYVAYALWRDRRHPELRVGWQED